MHAGVMPSCTTFTMVPLMLIVALRCVGEVFGCAVKSTAPEPVPIIVFEFALEAWGKEIQFEFAVAVQLHEPGLTVTGIEAGSGVALMVVTV